MIDTHTHLFLEQFDLDRHENILRAKEAGVQKLLLPNIDHTTTEAMMKMASDYPAMCVPMMGLHPSSVNKQFENELKHVESMLQKHGHAFCAIGEIGLDYYWDTSFKEQQKEAVKIQFEWALEYNLPVVLHARESFDDLFQLVESYLNRGLRGIFHCFTGSPQQAERIISYKTFLMGIGGVVTFKNGGLDKTLAAISPEHIVLETDSPFLSPSPYRGKRNESSYLPIIAKKIAEIQTCDQKELIRQTTKNAIKIFQGIS